MRKFAFVGVVLVVLFVQSCQSPEVITTPERINIEPDEDEDEILVHPTPTTLVPLFSISPDPTISPTPLIFDHAMFIVSIAEEFSMIETERPLEFIEGEVVDPAGKYRALEVCDSYCDIYVEELSSGVVYILTAPSLRRNRIYTDLTWSDEGILEFILVTQPHHGVKFIVNVETQEVIDAVPTPLE